LARIYGARCGWILKGRWDARQGVQQQPDENLGAQQAYPALGAGRFHGLRERGNPRHGRTRLSPGQVAAGEGRSPFLVCVEPDPGPPLGLLSAPLGRRRVHTDDRLAQRGPELAGCLTLRPAQDPFFGFPGVGVVEHAGEFGDKPCPRQVDPPLGKSRVRAWKPPPQGHREICPQRAPELRHGKREAHLGRGFR
jgi:hypothetical protein